MKGTWNRVQKGCQGTDAGNTDQGTGRMTGNSTGCREQNMEQGTGWRSGSSEGCREHGLGYGKDERELHRMQRTWNSIQLGCQGTAQEAGNTEKGTGRMKGNIQDAGNM